MGDRRSGEGLGGTAEERGHATVDVIRSAPLGTCPLVANCLQLLLCLLCMLIFMEFCQSDKEESSLVVFFGRLRAPALIRSLQTTFMTCKDRRQEHSWLRQIFFSSEPKNQVY